MYIVSKPFDTKKYPVLSTGYVDCVLICRLLAGIGTLLPQVVGLHRAGPSATLDKVMKFEIMIAGKRSNVKRKIKKAPILDKRPAGDYNRRKDRKDVRA